MSSAKSSRKNPPMMRQRRSGRAVTSSGPATRSRMPTGLDSLILRPRPRNGFSETHGRHSRLKTEPVGRSRHEPFIDAPAPRSARPRARRA